MRGAPWLSRFHNSSIQSTPGKKYSQIETRDVVSVLNRDQDYLHQGGIIHVFMLPIREAGHSSSEGVTSLVPSEHLLKTSRTTKGQIEHSIHNQPSSSQNGFSHSTSTDSGSPCPQTCIHLPKIHLDSRYDSSRLQQAQS